MEETTYIEYMDQMEIEESNSMDSEELIEPYDMFNGNIDDRDEEENDNLLDPSCRQMEDMDEKDDFLTLPLDADLEREEDENDGGASEREDGDPALDRVDFLNDIPTTNAGQVALEVEETVTEYGGTFGNIRISGHVLLNQCRSLLTRKKIN